MKQKNICVNEQLQHEYPRDYFSVPMQSVNKPCRRLCTLPIISLQTTPNQRNTQHCIYYLHTSRYLATTSYITYIGTNALQTFLSPHCLDLKVHTQIQSICAHIFMQVCRIYNTLKFKLNFILGPIHNRFWQWFERILHQLHKGAFISKYLCSKIIFLNAKIVLFCKMKCQIMYESILKISEY